MTPSQIRVQIEEEGPWRRRLSVTVPGAVVREERGHALERLTRGLKLPGFRKGRIPAAVAERKLGSAVQDEAVARVVDEAYRAALADTGLQPIGEARVEAVDYRPDGDLRFLVAFDVRPTIELPRLHGLRVLAPEADVGPQEVDRALEALREEHALWRPPDEDGPPRDSDLVMVRIQRLDERGEPMVGSADVGFPWMAGLRLPDGVHRGRYRLVLGEGDAIPAVEEAIKSLAPGETRDLRVPLGSGSGADLEPVLRITLHERQIRELPELDAAFLASLGDFADADALRARLRDDLREEAAARAEIELRARLLDAILEANPFEVPPAMVDRYAESVASGAGKVDTTDPAWEELRRAAERAVKHIMILDRIVETEKLRPSPEQVEARIAEIAAEGGTEPERIRARLIESGRLAQLERELAESRLFELLKARSELVRAR